MSTKDAIQSELDYFLNFPTPIQPLTSFQDNRLFVKREDAIPFSFGGNKVRIAAAYFQDAVRKGADTIVTYGASSSNLCRVVANFCCRYGMKCVIISPNENYVVTPNSEMVRSLGAQVIKCDLNQVSKTIDDTMAELRKRCMPYFIYGGGHGIIGASSYRTVMAQIADYTKANQTNFAAIYLTCATGTSTAGLVIEKAARRMDVPIFAVSIARKKERAEAAIDEILKEEHLIGCEEKPYVVMDDYICQGYGTFNENISKTIRDVFCKEGLYMDTTYTGKAFCGMLQHLKQNGITGKNILFIHTGGAPLFFKDNCAVLF